MLSFFKINDPSRIIALFILLLLIRLPFYIHGIPETLTELNLLLVGEKLANGGSLYISLWEDISPLSAWVYMVLYFFFGKSAWGYHILAFLVVFYQSILFNSITYRNKVYTENTYVPALVYGLLVSISFEMYSLSPMLMSNTFILLALNNIFKQVEFRMKADEPILNIGIYLGIATLLFLPAGIFSIITLVCLGMFSSTIGRRYLLILFGFMLPIVIVSAFYFFNDGLHLVWQIFLFQLTRPESTTFMEYTDMFLLLAIPLLYLLISFFRVFQRNRFSNYQVRIVQLSITMLFLALGVVIWSDKIITVFFFAIPTFAIILSHNFYLIKSRLKAEMSFLIFLGGILLMNYSIIYNWFNIDNYVNHDNLLVQENPYENYTMDKKIVVLGNNMSIYNGASLATPFFDWQLSKVILTNPDYYGNATTIYKGFINDLPEIIIDLEQIFPAIQARVPLLEEKYNRLEKGVYELIQ